MAGSAPGSPGGPGPAWGVPALALLVLAATRPEPWAALLGPLFPGLEPLVYARAPLAVLLAEHAWLVLASSSLALAIGCGLGILVTRRRGREFLPVVDGLAAIGQTVPPVAVLALAVPLAGFGTRPTLAALVLYGVLPVVRATVSGIESVPRAVREAAVGMGMTDFQTLLGVELRLAWPVILAGVRTSVVINVGTATIGATVGAGGLGAPIIAGITAGNPAWVLEGAALAGLLAVLADAALGRLGGGRSSG